MSNRLSQLMLSQGFDVKQKVNDRRNNDKQNALTNALLQTQNQNAQINGKTQQLQNYQAARQLAQQGRPQQNTFKPETGNDGNRYQVEYDPSGRFVNATPIQGMGQQKPKPLSDMEKKIGFQAGMDYNEMTSQQRSDAFRSMNAPKAGNPFSNIKEQKNGRYTGVDAGGVVQQLPQSPEVVGAQATAKGKFIEKQQQDYLAITDTIDTAIGQANGSQTMAHGFPGQVLSNIGGTDAYALDKSVETIKANLAFDKLQAIREASKTGGGLGSVSENELSLLSSSIANLDAGLPYEQKVASLKKIQEHYNNFITSLGGQVKASPIVADDIMKQADEIIKGGS